MRCVLAVSVKDFSLRTADVSVAFMNAPVEEDALDLVLLLANMTINGMRIVVLLFEAMNGLRRDSSSVVVLELELQFWLWRDRRDSNLLCFV